MQKCGRTHFLRGTRVCVWTEVLVHHILIMREGFDHILFKTIYPRNLRFLNFGIWWFFSSGGDIHTGGLLLIFGFPPPPSKDSLFKKPFKGERGEKKGGRVEVGITRLETVFLARLQERGFR